MRLISLFVASACLFAPAVHATDTMSIAKLPQIAESPEKGVFPNFVRAMNAAGLTNFEMVVVPFPRSLRMVSGGQSVAHFPFLDPENGVSPGDDLMFSSEPLYNVTFALYTHADKPVSMDDLATANLETEASHVEFFDFSIEGSTCLECSLQKVEKGRIDGFIFSEVESDGLIDTAGLTNIRKEVYHKYPVKFVLKAGDTKTDAHLTQALQAMKDSGELAELLAPLIR